MKQICAYLLFIALVTTTGTALGEKARNILGEQDAAYHAEHLAQHIGEDECFVTGNYIKAYKTKNKEQIAGHVEQADQLILLDVQGRQAKIQVLRADQSSPDSYDGLTGWVNADYVDCLCSSVQYSQPAEPAPDLPPAGQETVHFTCTTNNLRVRETPRDGKILGHIEQEDQFLVLDVQDGWGYIEVVYAAPSSPDSWVGLSGWVSMEYVKDWHGEDNQLNKNDEFECYKPILDVYYHYLKENVAWEDFDEQYGNGEFNNIVDAAHEGMMGFDRDCFVSSLEDGYILRDTFNDGTKELYILTDDYVWKSADRYEPAYLVVAVYTIKNNRPVRILQSWARNRNYLRKDGKIYNEGSSGAAYSTYELISVTGDHLSQERVLSRDGGLEDELQIVWYYTTDDDHDFSNDTRITEQQAERYIDAFASKLENDSSDFVSFAEYGRRRK